MDYNAVIQSITENWSAIMSTILVGGGSFWALLNKISKNKFNHELGSFQSTVTRKFDAVGKTTFDVLSKVDKSMSAMEQRISSMEKTNQVVSQENLVLSNLVVELMALAPIPLSAKEKFYGGIHDMTIINDKVKDALLAIQEAQKIQKQTQDKKETELYEKLDSGV